MTSAKAPLATMSGFFSQGVAEADPELFESIKGELAASRARSS